jgi:AcrR family transcriptional regulator
MVVASGSADGRVERSRRTRAAVVDALLALVQEGDARPSVAAIARRAGVSARTVHLHFGSVSDLHAALAARTTELVLDRLAVISPTERIEVRVDLLTGQRARINEELGALLRAADRLEDTSPQLASAREFGRRSSREQLVRIFRAELDPLPVPARARLVAAIDALLTPASWQLARESHGLSPDEARLAMRDAVLTLLVPRSAALPLR